MNYTWIKTHKKQNLKKYIFFSINHIDCNDDNQKKTKLTLSIFDIVELVIRTNFEYIQLLSSAIISFPFMSITVKLNGLLSCLTYMT